MRDQIRELTEKCHEVTAILVHAMLDRARAFTSSDLHDEKMVSLGKLSAGLAHELNNPAAAIERSAALLDEQLEDSERATRALGTFKLTEAQLAAVDAIRAGLSGPTRAPACGPRSSRPNARRRMADWLDDRGLDIGIAEALADTAVDVRSARYSGAVDRRAGVEHRAEVGRVGVFGPQPRLGDSGCCDAHLGPGCRNQRLHAHGSGVGRRTRGPGPGS